ncbi:hypothetical protein STENM223S_06022 [Streptomyces tendae]
MAQPQPGSKFSSTATWERSLPAAVKAAMFHDFLSLPSSSLVA